MAKETFHWHCDSCGWDSEHSDKNHSVTCFVLNPTALKPRPTRKTSQEEYEAVFKQVL